MSMFETAVVVLCIVFFFFKQKTAYEMRISDWSSDVCSSDLVDIGVADHELLEDVVLDRPVERRPVDPLLLARDDEEGEDRNHRAVHRHADRHLVERDAVEQYLHILDAVDRDPRLADVADDAHMVAVIAAVGRQIEGNAEALLPRRQIAEIESVRILGGRHALIFPDRTAHTLCNTTPPARGEGGAT